MIAYSGKSLGNLSPTFGADAEANQNEFFKDLPANSNIYMINPGTDSIVNADKLPASNNPQWVDCEGLITQSKNTTPAIFPADCIPLVIYSKDQNILCLLHISTKNAENALIQDCIKKLKDNYKSQVSELKIYIGPSIKKESYTFDNLDDKEISRELSDFINQEPDGWHIDVLGYIVSILKNEGISEKISKLIK